jgi:hypothetical protein
MADIRKLGMVASGATILLMLAGSGNAGAVDLQSSLRDRQLQIEQNIRRNYNAQSQMNAQRPSQYRFRERHLGRDSSVSPGMRVPTQCAYQYRRWQRSGNDYWLNRYLDCSG